MKITKTLAVTFGQKTGYLDMSGDKCKFVCHCDSFFRVGMVVIPLTREQAENLLKRANGNKELCIQEILPNTPKELREIFMTGQTPAEYDHAFMQRKHWRDYLKFGYQFDYTLAGPDKMDAVDKTRRLKPSKEAIAAGKEMELALTFLLNSLEHYIDTDPREEFGKFIGNAEKGNRILDELFAMDGMERVHMMRIEPYNSKLRNWLTQFLN